MAETEINQVTGTGKSICNKKDTQAETETNEVTGTGKSICNKKVAVITGAVFLTVSLVIIGFAIGLGLAVPDCTAECGLTNSRNRIVGGNPSDANEYPWLVGLSSNDNNNRPFCGGSIYNNDWIITAAHCVEDTMLHRVKLVLGMYNYYTNTPKPTSRSVSQIIVHSGYSSRTMDNDIALIRMSSSVTFSSSIRPVCLPFLSADYTGQMATVTGWGTLSSGGSKPAMAYDVQVPIRSQAECLKSYGLFSITNNMICAGTDTFNKDSCQGDSGGPLTVSVNGHHYLAGIVSWGRECAQSPYYGVYTNVSNYISWIQSKAGAGCIP